MKKPNVSFGEARRRWVRIKFIERLRLMEWLISWAPRKKTLRGGLFFIIFIFFLSSKYVIPASVSPLVFSIASRHFANGLPCISLCCLPNFVSLASLSRPTLSPLNIKSLSVFTLPLLSSPLSVSLPVFVTSLPLTLSLRHSNYTVLTVSVRDVSLAAHARKHTIS